MASFTDSIPQFNPYVQQLPVEAMVAVGMEKQKRYDEGVQKIQQSIDKVAGLEVVKDSEKAYLQSKLNQLGNDLTFVAAGDFSNYQLVNSVDGMAKQIAYDPNIQTAVSSAARRRKEIEFMEEARKKGELTPQNELYFKTRDAEWINNPELGQAYNAKYVPYVDRFKLAKEKFDAIKPDGLTFDEVYQKGPDGKYVTDKNGNLVLSEAMTRVKEEGYLPVKLQATIDEIFSDPRFNQQLTIDAEYNYRGVSKEDLAISVTKEANKLKNTYEDKLDELNIQLQLYPDNDELKQQIKNTELAISKIGENLQETGKLISENPNAVKTSLYKSSERDNYTAMFNYSKRESTVEVNPRWEAKFKIQKEANEERRWAQEQEWKRYEFNANYEQKERHKKMDIDKDLSIAKLKSGKGTPSQPGDNLYGLYQDVEDQDFNDILYHQDQVQTAAKEMMNNQLEFVWGTMFASNENNENALKKEMKKTVNGQYITREDAIKNIITKVAASKGYKSYDEYMADVTSRARNIFNSPNGKKLKSTNPALFDTMIKYQESEKNYSMQKSIDKEVLQQSNNSLYNRIKNIEFNDKIVNIGDRKYTLTKDDALQLAIIGKYESLDYKSKIFGTPEAIMLKKASDAAKAKLENSGKGELANNWEKSFTASKEKRRILDKQIQKDKAAGINRTNSFQTPYYVKDTAFRDVYKIYDALGDNFLDEVKVSANAVRKIREINPNLSGSVTTGDDKQDKVILSDLKAIINTYDKNKNATGVDPNDVISKIKELKDVKGLTEANITKGIEKDASGQFIPYIQIDGSKLYLNNQESDTLDINPSTIYNDEAVIATEGMIAAQGGKSSYGPIDKVSTYREEVTPLDNNDFPLLQGSNYTAKVNFKLSNGKYYPYVYINNGNTEKIVPIQGSDSNLGKLMREVLPAYISPATLKQLLNQ